MDVGDYFGEHARKTDAAMHNCTLHKADGDEFLWCWAPLSLVGPVSLFDPLSLVVPVPGTPAWTRALACTPGWPHTAHSENLRPGLESSN